jgi:hypothetical protein
MTGGFDGCRLFEYGITLAGILELS